MDQIIQDKKVALVTGGGTGMGRAVAMAFSRAMIRLAVIDKNEEGEKTAEMIRGSGGEAFFIRADVTNQDDARHMVNKTIKTFGRLDYAFNNTNFFMESRSISGKIRSVSWDFVVGMNLIGIWLCMKYEVTQMLKNKQGSIVNLGSFTSRTGFLNNMTYMQAVNTWTKTAALEYNAYGLRVNAVCADINCAEVIDPLITVEREKRIQTANSRLFGSMQTEDQIARAVIWLSSDEAALVTGYPLVFDQSNFIRKKAQPDGEPDPVAVKHGQ